MIEDWFDITIIRWLNLLIITILIFYAGILMKQLKSYCLGIPALVWLGQAFIFYSIFLLYNYDVIVLSLSDAATLFSNWATLSRLLGLITMFLYLYYIKHSCWRGNDK